VASGVTVLIRLGAGGGQFHRKCKPCIKFGASTHDPWRMVTA